MQLTIFDYICILSWVFIAIPLSIWGFCRSGRNGMPSWYVAALRFTWFWLLLWALAGLADDYFVQFRTTRILHNLHVTSGGALFGLGIFILKEKRKLELEKLKNK